MKLEHVKIIAFDFDGVFTDNFVYVDSNGRESVRCSREDSLGLNRLKKEIQRRALEIKMLIISTETNEVVSSRANKLNIESFLGVDNKAMFLIENFGIVDGVIPGLVFLGNDLNDLEAIQIAEFSLAPESAVKEIRDVANGVIPRNGGEGFIRNFCELLISS